MGPTQDFLSFQGEVPEHTEFSCYAYRQIAPSNGTILRLAEAGPLEGMTILGCKAFCLSQGYHVFGLMGGDSCLCDSRLRMDHERLIYSKCDTPCNGNSSEVCGGDGAVQVYSLEPKLPVEAISLGCFKKVSDTLYGKRYAPAYTSVKGCGNACTSRGNTLFGLDDGNACTCANELRPGAEAGDMSQCNLECADGFGYICGSSTHVEVYKTKSGQLLSSKEVKRATAVVPDHEYFGC